MKSRLEPVRNRGRPRKASGALTKGVCHFTSCIIKLTCQLLTYSECVQEAVLLVHTLAPGRWVKSHILHPEFGFGWVVNHRTKPDEKKTIVWSVSFLYPPDVRKYGPQTFEMEAEESNTCLIRYKESSQRVFLTALDEND